MKLVIQRVSKASVSVDSKVVGKINSGLLVLVGVTKGDDNKDADFLAEKLSKLRIMSDENDPTSHKASAVGSTKSAFGQTKSSGRGKMNLSIKDVSASVLVISQFTLHADTKKGNRPSFIKAARPDLARDLYKYFVSKLVELGIHTKTGKFGAYMDIDAKLDGPVTILLDSK